MSKQEYFIMGSEPLSDWTVDDVRKWLSTHKDIREIVINI